jgi:hypothetical protein
VCVSGSKLARQTAGATPFESWTKIGATGVVAGGGATNTNHHHDVVANQWRWRHYQETTDALLHGCGPERYVFAYIVVVVVSKERGRKRRSQRQQQPPQGEQCRFVGSVHRDSRQSQCPTTSVHSADKTTTTITTAAATVTPTGVLGAEYQHDRRRFGFSLGR